MKPRRIRTKSDNEDDSLEIRGWLHGDLTYLWFGIDGECIGTIAKQKLYRLAKAIVKQFESE